MKKIIALVTIVGVSACAKQPDQIAAADIGNNEYRGYSCKQLAETEVKYQQALTNLSAQQKSAASGDAWGVFLLGLPISSMSGSDKETAIAVTKGHLQSIELEKIRKSCG
ncbi:hypothetical protein [Roseovarius litoreus]|uniref:hypothetical protein n=1 Tax=Roseovarius litoreus TaxID=1155722 RepID=UPI001CB835A7|nr:hypothetical protein [Roseovarius litoreus]